MNTFSVQNRFLAAALVLVLSTLQGLANTKYAACQASCVNVYNTCSGAATDAIDGQNCMSLYDACLDDCNLGMEGPSDSVYILLFDFIMRGMEDPDRPRQGCPPGTTTNGNDIGICFAIWEGGDPQPGCEPTEDDNCRPRITLEMVPRASETFVFCPAPMMPMPGGTGCRPAIDPEADVSAEGARQCPSGMEPGPDDRCVPSRRVGAAGEYDAALQRFIADGGTDRGRLEELRRVMVEAGIGTFVSDSAGFVERTSEALGPDWALVSTR